VQISERKRDEDRDEPELKTENIDKFFLFQKDQKENFLPFYFS